MRFSHIKLLFAYCLFCCFGTLQAQTYILHFKDGGQIEGQIIEQKVGESVTVKLSDGQVKSFPEAEISNMTLRQSQKLYSPPPSSYVSRRDAFLSLPFTGRADRSIFHHTSLGLGFGTNRRGNVAVNPSFTYRGGYRLNQYLNFGVGLSLDPYESGLFAPIFAHFNGDIGPTKKTMPHYFADIGYGFPLAESWNVNELKGGLMYQVGIGYKFLTRRRSEWTFTLGYKSQDTWQRFDDWRTNGEVVGGRTYRRIVFQVGLGF